MRRWVALLCLPLCAACGDEPVTEIFACFSVDPVLSQPGGELRICSQTDDGSRLLFGCDGSGVADLTTDEISQGYVARRAGGVLLELEATVPPSTPGGPSSTVVQRARVSFVPDRVVDVSLRVEEACLPVVCPADETCVGGECRPVDVDAACLADHGAPAPDGCVDPRLARGCAGGG